MPSQEEHRVVDSPSGIFATTHLPSRSSLLDVLEDATQADEIVGEGSDNYPPPSSAAEAGQPSTYGPGALLLTRTGEEMAQLGRVERLAKLVSSWETFFGAYGAELKVSEFFFVFQYWFLLLLSHTFCFAVFTSRSRYLVWSS